MGNMTGNMIDVANLGFGLGLRSDHYSDILGKWPKDVEWFEVISENFMDTEGVPKRILGEVLEHYPVVMHGVSLSIGTVDPLNSEYLSKLRKMMEWVKPAWVSDHLCWTGVAHKTTHDLLPVPYTEEALSHIIDRIKSVQDFLGRRIVLENPSTYLEFKESAIPEWEFINRMAEGSDCGLLLDVNNIYVTCYNHRLSPKDYIDGIDLDRVYQIHLAGHTNKGTHIIDTHDDYVVDEVWALYRYVLNRAGRKINTMVEWDDNIPAFSEVLGELNKAKSHYNDRHKLGDLPEFDSSGRSDIILNNAESYGDRLGRMQKAIFCGAAFDSTPSGWIRDKADFRAADQLGVYINGYRLRLIEVIEEDYPALQAYLGEDELDSLIRGYIEESPPSHFNLNRYCDEFLGYVKGRIDNFGYELSVLEATIAELFHQPETEALSDTDIKGIGIDDLLVTELKPRLALRLLKFNHRVNKYYQEATMDDKRVNSCEEAKEYLAVYRDEGKVWRLELEEDEYSLLERLFDKKNVGTAIEELADSHKDSEDFLENILTSKLQTWFARWMSNRLFSKALA